MPDHIDDLVALLVEGLDEDVVDAIALRLDKTMEGTRHGEVTLALAIVVANLCSRVPHAHRSELSQTFYRLVTRLMETQ